VSAYTSTVSPIGIEYIGPAAHNLLYPYGVSYRMRIGVRAVAVCLALVSAAGVGWPDDRDAHWPQWRGPFDNGVARTAAPVEWSGAKNLAWKIDIPGRGNSSPIIWGDRIFVTTAVPATLPAESASGGGMRGPGGGTGAGIEHRFLVLCLDRKSGKMLWERTATVAKPHEGYHFRYGSFASNSPVTDGRYVYAFFGSRGMYCYDFEGKLIWKKDFPPMRMRLGFGEGVAPVLDGDRLILNFDQEDNSFIVVLNKRDGSELWRSSRDEMSAWSQPLVVEYGGKRQVIVAASNKVRSYDAATGKLIWECRGLGANVIPAPVSAAGVVYVMSGFRNPNLMAIRLGREGDLTGSDAVLWSNTRGNSYTPSPVLDGDKLYFISDNGLLTCLNAKTGEPYYLQQRLPKPYSFKASPVGAGGKLYLATEDGDVVVVKMGEKFEVAATNKLAGEMFVSTPAVADGSLYLRDAKTLYCIRESAR
jgi:outer membrane protein assembly factor BamB